jgi:hypothetical protein
MFETVRQPLCCAQQLAWLCAHFMRMKMYDRAGSWSLFCIRYLFRSTT